MVITSFIFILAFMKTAPQSLPSSGQFVITKYSDSSCENAFFVSLYAPSNPCWSSDFLNGIKPTSYNISSQELFYSYYQTDSCYATHYKTLNMICDNSCQSYPMDKSKSISCAYVPFPSKANFTFERYADSECTKQKGISVLRGASNCWKLGEELSISPVDFNVANTKDLKVVTYLNGQCSGNRTQEEDVKCDRKCFSFEKKNDEYYRCSYVGARWMKYNYFVVGVVLYLMF